MIAFILAATLAGEFPPKAASSITLSYGGVTSDLGQTYIDLASGTLIAARRRRGESDRYSDAPLIPKVQKQIPPSDLQRMRNLTSKVLEHGAEMPLRERRCEPNAHYVRGIELHLDGRSLAKDFVFCPTRDAEALMAAIYEAEAPY